ncbi:MAG TPA: DUF2178 domain-containing protein [Methanosarcinaceae archaeon]|nr:DUF2178 domain-containing protein [Methanosarcinaceae archaeon]
MEFRTDKYFLVNLSLIIVGLALATSGIINIFRNISDGNPESLLRAIFPVLIGLGVSMSSFFRILNSGTGVVGDERTRKVAKIAGLYAFLILLGLLVASASIAGALQLDINFSLAVIVISYIGIFSWGILTFYFNRKGDLE